jgi:CBS domain-containing protein
MQVQEVMTREVQLVDPGTTIRDAARTMRDEDIGALPVGENDRLVGMVTDRDIVLRAVAEGQSPDNTSVREVMSKGILYCFEDVDVSEAAQSMAENHVRRLPVLNRDKRLVGVVALADLSLEADQATSCAALKGVSEPSDVAGALGGA